MYKCFHGGDQIRHQDRTVMMKHLMYIFLSSWSFNENHDERNHVTSLVMIRLLVNYILAYLFGLSPQNARFFDRPAGFQTL